MLRYRRHRVRPLVVTLLVEIKIFRTFFCVSSLVFSCRLRQLYPFALALQGQFPLELCYPKIVSINFPCGVDVSSCSFRLLSCTSFAVSVSTIFSKSVVERANRENSDTISSSPSRRLRDARQQFHQKCGVKDPCSSYGDETLPLNWKKILCRVNVVVHLGWGNDPCRRLCKSSLSLEA